ETMDIFVRDRQMLPTGRVSVASDGKEGVGSSSFASISADGRCVAFASDATNLMPVDTNAFTDIFVHDRQTGETERVSLHTDGGQANGPSSLPFISADGRFVAFASEATNLTDALNRVRAVFVHDRHAATTLSVSFFDADG